MQEGISYSVGGHTFRVEGNEETRLLREIVPGFVYFETKDSQTEWQILFGCQIEKPAQWEVLYNFVFEESEISSVLAKVGETYYFYMEPKDTKKTPLLMRYQCGNTVEATAGLEPEMLRFSLWMALNMLAAPSKMTLVHSSVIVHNGRAVLFLGESGTGKSTHTRLWIEHIPQSARLNDDSPVLAFENGEAVVYGSPWSGKTNYYIPRRFPLAGVVRLSQAKENKIRRLNVLESFSALQPSCPPALAQDGHFQDLIVDLISDVLSVTPVFHLACLPDADAAWTSHDAIFGHIDR